MRRNFNKSDLSITLKTRITLPTNSVVYLRNVTQHQDQFRRVSNSVRDYKTEVLHFVESTLSSSISASRLIQLKSPFKMTYKA